MKRKRPRQTSREAGGEWKRRERGTEKESETEKQTEAKINNNVSYVQN